MTDPEDHRHGEQAAGAPPTAAGPPTGAAHDVAGAPPTEAGPPAGDRGGAGADRASVRDLLAAYDREVEASLDEARASDTGTGRVRALHNGVRPSIAVHDAVLESTLCPLIERLPGGPEVTGRLREGCRERAGLLRRFDAISKGVAAHNVYPVSGDEVEHVLGGLARSVEASRQIETTEVGSLLNAAASSIDPDVVSARMAIDARNAPTRVHHPAGGHHGSEVRTWLNRHRDRVADWIDTHHGWSDPRDRHRSPRARQVEELKREHITSPLTVADLLSAYDRTVDDVIAELRAAGTDTARAEAAHRLNAAITIHDSVLAGVVCPLIGAVPGGREVSARLQEGCRQRAALQRTWNGLTHRTPPGDVYRLHRSEAEGIVDSLIESFHSHGEQEAHQEAALLDRLPGSAYRKRTSALADFMWPWHSEGPEVLALRMALWANAAPTRAHRLLVRHPSSRALRSFYRMTDHFQDFWGDATLERWLFPRLPAHPFSEVPGAAVPGAAVPGGADRSRPAPRRMLRHR